MLLLVGTPVFFNLILNTTFLDQMLTTGYKSRAPALGLLDPSFIGMILWNHLMTPFEITTEQILIYKTIRGEIRGGYNFISIQ